MLADSAPNVAEALGELGTAVFEWKLDGARVQVHREAERVAVYTRSLNDVTAAVPEVVDAVRALPARDIILDGEVIALDRRCVDRCRSRTRCAASASVSTSKRFAQR